MKSLIALIVVGAASIIGLTWANAQSEKFIKVDGDSLAAKLATAQSRAGAGKPHWVAYSFEVRPNVGFDLDQMKVVSGASGAYETSNLGVFMLYRTKGSQPERVEVYNLDRQRDYEGMPVYWLGRVATSESLDFLRKLLPQANEIAAGQNITDAIALHNDNQTGAILEDLLRHASQEGVRKQSAFWLGRIPGHLQTLAEVAGNEQEALSVRKQAVMAIGKSRENDSGAALQSLYSSASNRELKEEILEAAAKNRQTPAIDLLNTVAQSGDDPDLKTRARDLLMKSSGKKEKNKAGKSM